MGDSPSRPPVPGFLPASSLARPTPSLSVPASTTTPTPTSNHVPSGSSLRNAAGGQPSIPRPKPVNVPGASTNDASSIDSIIGGSEDAEVENKQKENAVAGPSKPVQRPVTRKNAIVYNAVQVSDADFSLFQLPPL
jgi:hypothetical protein